MESEDEKKSWKPKIFKEYTKQTFSNEIHSRRFVVRHSFHAAVGPIGRSCQQAEVDGNGNVETLSVFGGYHGVRYQ